MPRANGIASNGPMGNRRGTGPATSVSPVSLANKIDEMPESRAPLHPRLHLVKTATEVTRASPRLDLSAAIVDEGAETEIDSVFRRAIAGLRRLPRRERPHALRAARDARTLALKALREKRARERDADRIRRTVLTPPEPS